jgi:SAM-dependent methyltransferase
MELPPDLQAVQAYYSRRLAEFGPTHRGVDWNSTESQQLRFTQLLRIWDGAAPLLIGDYGCGYAGLIDHLRALTVDFSYAGYDIAEDMVAMARERCADVPRCTFSTEESVLIGVEYLVASGVFNVKLDADPDRWQERVLQTLDRFAVLARRGFAFNAMTSYSDPERKRSDLYYPDPCFFFDHCKRRYSRQVSLLHDYGLYEFTLLVRL